MLNQNPWSEISYQEILKNFQTKPLVEKVYLEVSAAEVRGALWFNNMIQLPSKFIQLLDSAPLSNPLPLLIPGILDPCSTGGGAQSGPLRKVANIADMITKFGTMVNSDKSYTICYFVFFA